MMMLKSQTDCRFGTGTILLPNSLLGSKKRNFEISDTFKPLFENKILI
jgi:hypothetical protein